MNASVYLIHMLSRWLWQRTRKLAIVVCLLTLSGCLSAPSAPLTAPRMPPPAAAMVECNPATEPPDGTLAGVSFALDSTAWTLSACRLAFRELRGWVNQTWSK